MRAFWNVLRTGVTVMFGTVGVLGLAQSIQGSAKSVAEVLGHSKNDRLLVIQAEDLGMAHSINNATFQAIENGWVTAANVLIPAPWFPEVVRWSRNHPNNDFGIQLDLNSEWTSYRWRSVSSQPANSGLSDPAGYLPNSARYVGQHSQAEEVAIEFRAQVDEAKNASIPISHLDSHGGIALYNPWLFQEYWSIGNPAVCIRCLPCCQGSIFSNTVDRCRRGTSTISAALKSTSQP